MRKSQMTNAQLIKAFENACFRFTNYPSNKTIAANYAALRTELAKRLGVPQEDIEVK